MNTLRLLFACGWLAVAALPAAGKTLVFCSEADPEALNPQLATSVTGMNAAEPIFNGLVHLQPDGSVIPELAESWTVSPDGTEYTFRLRHGVKFHGNAGFTPTRDFNADDVLFSFNRQWRRDTLFPPPKGLGFTYFADMDMPGLLQGIERVDDLTVRFRLRHPEAPFLADLAMPFAMILSAEYADTLLKAGRPDALDREPIGTGPFRFADYRREVTIRYTAFDAYWGGRPPVDTLVYSITPNAAVRLTKLKAGECQAMSFPNPTDADAIEKDPHLVLLRQDGLNIGYVSMNTTRPPFDDVRIRRAVNMAVDKDTIVRAVYGRGGTPAKNPLPPSLWSYNDAVEAYRYDPDAAQALMIEAGQEKGFDVDLLYMPASRACNPDSHRFAEMMAEDLGRIGIRAHLTTVAWDQYHHKVLSGDTTMAFYCWTSDNGDPDNFLGILLSCHDGVAAANNIARWCNRDYDALIAEAKLTSDQAKRDGFYRQAQQIAHDQAPWLPLAHGRVLSAVRTSLHGFSLDPFGRFLFDKVDVADTP